MPLGPRGARPDRHHVPREPRRAAAAALPGPADRLARALGSAALHACARRGRRHRGTGGHPPAPRPDRTSLGFTAYLVACFARAIGEDRRVAAMRHGRRRLLVFDEVDIALPVEHEVEDDVLPCRTWCGARIARPSRTSTARSRRAPRVQPLCGRQASLGRVAVPARLAAAPAARPGPRGRASPQAAHGHCARVHGGPAVPGRAWAVPGGTSYPVSLVIGGIRHGDDGRQSVALTVTFDHDTVNGAPAARFVRRFTRLVESARSSRTPDQGAPGRVMTPAPT